MIERTHGGAGRAGDLMLPDNARVVRRPGDVQMQPGTSRREFFQEQARRDRAAAVLAGVADIGESYNESEDEEEEDDE